MIPLLTFTDKDLRHRPIISGESQSQPDLLTLDKTIAVECHVIGKEFTSRLIKYGHYYNNLILCIPVPYSVKEIWVYQIEQNKVIETLKLSEKIKQA